MIYEERLERLGLPTLEEKRKTEDLAAMYRAMKEIETIDKGDLF